MAPVVERTSTFLDRLFQHVPADQQAAARPIYSQLADRVNQVDTVAQQQAAWWEKNQHVAADNARLQTELAEARRAAVTNPGMDQNAIQKAIDEATARTLETGLGLITTVSNLSAQHMVEFHESLDTAKLSREALAAGTTIDGYYAQSVAGRRQERSAVDLAAQIKAAREEGTAAGRKEVMDSMGRQMPFPSPSGANAPTTLAGLRKPADGSNPYSVDAAVQTAMDVMTKQNQ